MQIKAKYTLNFLPKINLGMLINVMLINRGATRTLLREELNGKFLWRHFDDEI